MKRIVTAILACLLLCGCGVDPSGSVEPTQQPVAAAPTESAGSYAPGSQIETAAAGAVRAYPQSMTEITGLRTAGNDLLVFSGSEQTAVTRLTGENLSRVAEVQLDLSLEAEDPGLYVSEDWLIYYDQADNALIYLDKHFREFNRLQLPEDLEGYPVLSDDRKQLYYCTISGVRCMDIESGISRLIKEMNFAIQSAADILLDGTVLAVCVSDGVSSTETLYLDARTGALIHSLTEDMHLKTGTEFFYAIDTEGVVNQMIFGTAEQTWMLTPEDHLDSGEFLPEAHAAVVYTRKGTLDHYDLASGKRTASLVLGELRPQFLTASEEGYLYFLQDGATVCRWDPAASPTGDETIYTGPRYTLDSPDQAALDECLNYAQALSQKYGLDIRVFTDAVEVRPFDYDMVPEYQVPVIMDGLSQLDEILANYPEGFFQTAVEGLENGKLTVCLVRSLLGSPESGSLERTDGTQFWDENHAYVAVALGEAFVPTFYHQMFHFLETRVLSESIAYYRWDELNPRGFDYDYDYAVNQNRDGSEYLEEKSRAFIDTYSMSFPKEDRARVMEYACMPGNENYFISYTMQKKLRTLCTGLREAYGLEDVQEVFLWEQYLESPLTPEA